MPVTLFVHSGGGNTYEIYKCSFSSKHLVTNSLGDCLSQRFWNVLPWTSMPAYGLRFGSERE